jgi:hypothetical protein
MTQYEVLSILISCVAAVISLAVWSGQRKLAREANDLQRATSELAKKQLEILLREEKGKNTARLSLELVRQSTSTFRFRLTNVSEVDARDVELKLLLKDPARSPIIDSDYTSKFPAPRIAPGTSISLIAALTLSSPTAYNALIKWTNPDGSRIEDETYVAL